MPRPSHLVQRRAGFAFRITVPADLRPLVGLREVVRSLRAPTRRDALAICRRAGQSGSKAFAMLRRMAEIKTLDLKTYRTWLLEQIEQELDVHDRRTSAMSAAERQSWDAFTDVELEDVARALEPPPRPLDGGDRLAQTVLERQGLSLDSLDATDQHAARIEALAAWADLLLLKSESATDTTRSFASRAQVLAQRRAVLGAQTSHGSGSVGVLSIEAIRQQQGLDC